MSDVFGTAGGTSAAIADMGRLAQTQGQQLQNASVMQLQQEQQRMAQLAQQQNATPGETQKSPADQLEDMASLAMKSGLTASGAKLATQAADIRLKQAQMTQAQAGAFNKQATAAKAELDTVDRLLQGVHDQASWDAANSLFSQISGKQSPFAGMEYNPHVVKSLQDSTLSLKDKLELKIKEFNAQTQRAGEESAARFRAFRENHIRQQDASQDDTFDPTYKATGDNAVVAPTKSELDHASGVIEKMFPNLPTNEVNNAARTAAVAARKIKKSAGVTDDQAMQRAVQDMGDLHTVNQAYGAHANVDMPPARATGGYSADAIDGMARAYAQGNVSIVSGLGRNKADRNVRAQVISRAAAYQKEQGGDMASSPIQYKAGARGAIVNAQQAAKVDAAASALTQSGGIGDQFQEAIDALHRTGIPFANEAQMEVLRRSNDPRVSAFDTAQNGVVSEVAQILGRGTLTVNSMEEARRVINGWKTSAQAKAGLAQLKREADTTVSASEHEVKRASGAAVTPPKSGQDFSHLWN
jgi:hypothetical protein